MTLLRERPRLAAALCLGLVMLLALAMLAGAALAGEDDCATTADGGLHSPTQR